MTNAVSRSNLGAWLLKCNPALWDLAAFLRSGERITSWAVQRNYRAAMMAPGDHVLFWVSGDGRGGLPRGIWGAGQVVARPRTGSTASTGTGATSNPAARFAPGSRSISRCSASRSPPPTCALAAWSTSRCCECRRAPTRPGVGTSARYRGRATLLIRAARASRLTSLNLRLTSVFLPRSPTKSVSAHWSSRPRARDYRRSRLRASGLMRGELAAGSVGISPASGVAYGHRNPLGLQPADERLRAAKHLSV